MERKPFDMSPGGRWLGGEPLGTRIENLQPQENDGGEG